jgi:2-polyprenyl-3-methyl-5-hydroxy-6-metoxy-1,4-benzoquinol methylase
MGVGRGSEEVEEAVVGELKDAAWYDASYAAWEYRNADPAKTPWTPLHLAVLAEIRPQDRVLDLGCGVGALAVLRDRRDASKGQWCGVDFSAEAIKAAQWNTAHCVMTVDGHGLAPLRWIVGGIVGGLEKQLAECDVVVCSETLEHVADDLAVLAQIPRDKRVLLSVPNFDSAAHARFFSSPIEAFDRYRPLLAQATVRTVPSANPERCWYLIAGVRA